MPHFETQIKLRPDKTVRVIGFCQAITFKVYSNVC